MKQHFLKKILDNEKKEKSKVMNFIARTSKNNNFNLGQYTENFLKKSIYLSDKKKQPSPSKYNQPTFTSKQKGVNILPSSQDTAMLKKIVSKRNSSHNRKKSNNNTYTELIEQKKKSLLKDKFTKDKYQTNNSNLQTNSVDHKLPFYHSRNPSNSSSQYRKFFNFSTTNNGSPNHMSFSTANNKFIINKSIDKDPLKRSVLNSRSKEQKNKANGQKSRNQFQNNNKNLEKRIINKTFTNKVINEDSMINGKSSILTKGDCSDIKSLSKNNFKESKVLIESHSKISKKDINKVSITSNKLNSTRESKHNKTKSLVLNKKDVGDKDFTKKKITTENVVIFEEGENKQYNDKVKKDVINQGKKSANQSVKNDLLSARKEMNRKIKEVREKINSKSINLVKTQLNDKKILNLIDKVNDKDNDLSKSQNDFNIKSNSIQNVNGTNNEHVIYNKNDTIHFEDERFPNNQNLNIEETSFQVSQVNVEVGQTANKDDITNQININLNVDEKGEIKSNYDEENKEIIKDNDNLKKINNEQIEKLKKDVIIEEKILEKQDILLKEETNINTNEKIHTLNEIFENSNVNVQNPNKIVQIIDNSNNNNLIRLNNSLKEKDNLSKENDDCQNEHEDKNMILEEFNKHESVNSKQIPNNLLTNFEVYDKITNMQSISTPRVVEKVNSICTPETENKKSEEKIEIKHEDSTNPISHDIIKKLNFEEIDNKVKETELEDEKLKASQSSSEEIKKEYNEIPSNVEGINKISKENKEIFLQNNNLAEENMNRVNDLEQNNYNENKVILSQNDNVASDSSYNAIEEGNIIDKNREKREKMSRFDQQLNRLRCSMKVKKSVTISSDWKPSEFKVDMKSKIEEVQALFLKKEISSNVPETKNSCTLLDTNLNPILEEKENQVYNKNNGDDLDKFSDIILSRPTQKTKVSKRRRPDF